MEQKLTIIALEIKSCTQCPHFKAGMPYSFDGFDRGEDWHCTKQDKQIASFVEWHENPAVPEWCPVKIPSNGSTN